MKYRLYVDEVGNSDLNASGNPNHRYLSLTGVMFELGYIEKIVFPSIEGLKTKYFHSHPDDPVIFHRKEMVNKQGAFECLLNNEIEKSFNGELLDLLTSLDYLVFTAVIDKLEHKQRYSTWRFDPYHYCLTVLVERYVLWLKANNQEGDVMAESRGGKEDIRLKNSFMNVFEKGSDFLEPNIVEKYLTSKQLKVKPKSNNIAGLQIADLLAYPSFKCTLVRHNNEPLPKNFGGEIAQILEGSKYYRSQSGQINGWGRKWLP